MTEKETPSVESAPPPATKGRRWRYRLGAALLLAAALGGAWGGWQVAEEQRTALPVSVVPVRAEAEPARLAALEARVAKLEALTAEAGDADTIEPAPPLPSEIAAPSHDLDDLRAQVKALQADVGKASDKVDQSQQARVGERAALVAFVQLQRAASGSHPFANEVHTFRQTLTDPAGVQDDLQSLEALAAQGVPTAAQLVAQFATVRSTAEDAMRRAAATTWQDRVKVLLSSLIAVRDLRDKGSPEGRMAALADAVEAEQWGGVLEKVTQLPEAAQLALQPWRDRVLARFNLDAALDRLAADWTRTAVN
jgi:hypothetical protein